MCQVYVIAHKKVSIARHKFDNLPKISQKNLTVLALKSAIIRNLVLLYLSLNVRKILAKIGWFKGLLDFVSKRILRLWQLWLYAKSANP